MADFEYYAKLGVDAGEAVKEFGKAAKSSEGLKQTLDTLGEALKGVSKESVDSADAVGKNLGLYKQLTDAVGGYGRALKSLSTQDLVKGQEQFTQSLKNMQSALSGVPEAGKGTDRVKGQKETLKLYKELATVSTNYSKGLLAEAEAIERIVRAEQTRKGVAGTGGPDAQTRMYAAAYRQNEEWDRKRGALQIRARREMETDFQKRSELVQREGNLQARAHREMEADLEKRARTAEGTGRRVVAAEQNQERALASTRYALYEVTAAYTAVAAAAAALPVGAARSAIEMQAQFAHVVRTTQASTASTAALKREFMDLSTQIPVSFEELSRIGALGAQMGINIADLEQFTEVVAKFAATTNVSADEAAMSFGRIANMMDDIDPSKFEHLGSAISEMGTNSVATESEILVVAESIATAANMAGFSADEVVGLSTALASLRIRPEMARGAMQRVFAKINEAVADGSEQLTGYAKALNTTEAAAEALWRNDPSQFFQRLALGIRDMDDNIERSLFIRNELGLRNIRDVEMLSRLSNGYDVYADSMTLANDAYARGDYLDKETGPIFETTAASLEKLGSALKSFFATMGEDTLSPIRFAAEALIALLNAAKAIPAPLRAMAVTFSAVVAGIFALRAALALATASTLAFQLANRNLAATGGLSLRNFLNRARETFLGVRVQAGATTAAINTVTASTARLAGTATTAARSAGGLAMSLAGGPWGLAAAGLATAAMGIYSLVTAHGRAEQAARDHAEAFIDLAGGEKEFMAAIARDAEEFASGQQTKELGRLNIELGSFEGVAHSASDVLSSELIPGQQLHEESVRGVTKAYEDAYGAIGEHTDALIRKGLIEQLTSGDNAMSADQIRNLSDIGLDYNAMISLLEESGADSAKAYVDSFITEMVNERTAILQEMEATLDWSRQGEVDALTEMIDGAKRLKEGVVDVNLAVEKSNAAIAFTEKIGNPYDDLSDGAEDYADALKKANEQVDKFVGELFNIVDTEAAVYDAFDRLGKAMADNGANFNIVTEEGRANLAAFKGVLDATAKDLAAQMESGRITGEDAAMQYAGFVDGLLAELEAQGVDTADLLEMVHGDIAETFAQSIGVNIDVEPAMNDLEALQRYAWEVFAGIMAGQSSLRQAASGALSSVGSAARSGGTPAQKALRENQELQRQQRDSAKKAAEERTRALIDYQRQNQLARDSAKETKGSADQMKRLREEIAKANDEGRIFEEIMKGMRTAFSETLDNFNGMQSARDSMESQLHSMRNAAQGAKDEVSKLREEAAKLRREAADERVTAEQARIFAAVAQSYGDTTRYNQYTVEAADAAASAKEKDKLAKAAANEAQELDKNRNSLSGYSEQAIKNRDQVRQLQRSMSDLILEYAETGATTEEVTRYTEQLRRKFVDQMVQMGYNRTDAERLSRVFQDLKRDIDRVPREVRIKAQADVAEARRKINDLSKTQTVPIRFSAPSQTVRTTGNLEVADVKARKLSITQLERGGGLGNLGYHMMSKGGLIPGTPPTNRNIDNILTQGPNGLTAVQSGEYVVKTNAVNHYGLDFMKAINDMKMPRIMVTAPSGGGGNTGSGNLDLSPRSAQLLAQLVSTQLSIDGRVIASTTNSSNTNSARRGAN